MFTAILESKSTRTDITSAWLAKVAGSLTTQLRRDFCPDWGFAAWSCTTDVSVPGPHVVVFDTSDQAGALGYHAVGPDGQPYAKVFADGQSLDGVSVTASHEVLELVGDEPANRFALAIDGVAYAVEVCDPVEDATYEIDGVMVSDFITPAWFLAQGAAPFDHLDMLQSPLTRTAGGYWIELKNGSVDTSPAEAKSRAGKSHPASRTARRLGRA